jgi:hypothetical protein
VAPLAVFQSSVTHGATLAALFAGETNWTWPMAAARFGDNISMAAANIRAANQPKFFSLNCVFMVTSTDLFLSYEN